MIPHKVFPDIDQMMYIEVTSRRQRLLFSFKSHLALQPVSQSTSATQCHRLLRCHSTETFFNKECNNQTVFIIKPIKHNLAMLQIFTAQLTRLSHHQALTLHKINPNLPQIMLSLLTTCSMPWLIFISSMLIPGVRFYTDDRLSTPSLVHQPWTRLTKSYYMRS